MSDGFRPLFSSFEHGSLSQSPSVMDSTTMISARRYATLMRVILRGGSPVILSVRRRPRFALIVWLMMWMLFIPLVHTHLGYHDGETSDHGHHHETVTHTIFSPHIPHEHDTHNHASPSALEQEERGPVSVSVGATADTQEIEVAFVAAPDRKIQYGFVTVFASDAANELPRAVSDLLPVLTTRVPHQWSLSHHRSPRAPPLLA
jgi:hypothetical protein